MSDLYCCPEISSQTTDGFSITFGVSKELTLLLILATSLVTFARRLEFGGRLRGFRDVALGVVIGVGLMGVVMGNKGGGGEE